MVDFGNLLVKGPIFHGMQLLLLQNLIVARLRLRDFAALLVGRLTHLDLLLGWSESLILGVLVSSSRAYPAWWRLPI